MFQRFVFRHAGAQQLHHEKAPWYKSVTITGRLNLVCEKNSSWPNVRNDKARASAFLVPLNYWWMRSLYKRLINPLCQRAHNFAVSELKERNISQLHWLLLSLLSFNRSKTGSILHHKTFVASDLPRQLTDNSVVTIYPATNFVYSDITRLKHEL